MNAESDSLKSSLTATVSMASHGGQIESFVRTEAGLRLKCGTQTLAIGLHPSSNHAIDFAYLKSKVFKYAK